MGGRREDNVKGKNGKERREREKYAGREREKGESFRGTPRL